MKKLFFKISNDIVKYCFAFFCALYAICNILFTYWINNLSYYEKSINIGINIFNIVLLISNCTLLRVADAFARE